MDSPVTVDRHSEFSSLCKWSIPNFSKINAKSLYSPYFEVGGFDFRCLIYPKGDSLALPGHISLYLQINDPRGSSCDCYASYKLTIVNLSNNNNSLCKESCYRFSKNRKSIGWSEFTVAKAVLGPGSGFLNNGSLLVNVDIRVSNETISFSMDSNETKSYVLDGRVTWTLRNYGLFEDIIKTHKIISSTFRVGESNLRISLYESVVNGVEYLSLFLENKDPGKCILFERSCWCMFRISVLNQRPGLNHIHRDYHGRFGVNNISEEDTSLGWTEYMKMSDFMGKGYLVDDTVLVSVSLNAIKESSITLRTGKLFGGKNSAGIVKKNDGFTGKFLWNIENFVKLKDILKKKKITGLFVKSRIFRVGNMNFRLLVYPRGQSQKPSHLSLFLEVLDQGNTSKDWSSFIIYRLAVMNHKITDKSIIRESQNRCSKATKDWGWSEFMTLTNFFDQESGYLDQDTAVFTAEVRILKETFTLKSISDSSSKVYCTGMGDKRWSVTWKVENFSSLKDVIETQKIFSKFFQVGECKLRIGFYESVQNICVYAEGDPSVANDPDKNFWVSYRISVMNQKEPAKSLSKEASLLTKSCTNSELQLMEVSVMLEVDKGFIVRETVIFVCEILDWCPWFDFSEAELLAMDSDLDDSSSDHYELSDPENSKLITGNIENIFKMFLVSTGCYPMDECNPRQLLLNLKKLLMGTGAVTWLLVGMRFYLDDPWQVKCWFCQTECFDSSIGRKKDNGAEESSLMLSNVMTGIKFLQQTINHALLDIMVECCQPSDNSTKDTFAACSNPSANDNLSNCNPPESKWEIRNITSVQSSLYDGPRTGVSAGPSSAQCSISNGNDISKNTSFRHCAHPETSSSNHVDYIQTLKAKWPEPSEELLGLIVNSLKTLDGPVSHIHPKQRQKSQTADKVFLLLEKAPKHLQPDLVILLPKLVNHSEHSLASYALLDQLMKPNVELALQPLVLATISQLALDNEGWEQTFCRASQLLGESNGEALGTIIDFLFRSASQCQHIPQAVRVVLARLESLGAEVSPHVLDILSKTVNSQHQIAESMLREIGTAFALHENCLTNPSRPFSNGGEVARNSLRLVDEQLIYSHCHFSDIFLLINMLAIPSLAAETSQAFERGVAFGFIDDHSVAMVLERHAQIISVNFPSSLENYENQDIGREKNADSLHLEGVFTLVHTLARKLSLSRNSQVHGFVKSFYAMLFRFFGSQSNHSMMLKDLVDLAMSPADICSKISLDVLVFLVQKDQGFARPVLSMMKDAAEHASAECSIVQHRLCTIEKEIACSLEEKQHELLSISTEKDILLERLTESEAAILHNKFKMARDLDEFACEKKQLCERIHAIESEFEQLSSKQNEEVMKLSIERKDYQHRLHHVETQLSQLKSQKCLELKKVIKENEVLAERLKKAKAERENFDKELKRNASVVVAQEEARQTLMNEIGQLKQKMEQIEGVKQEREEEEARFRAYTNVLETKLSACQQYIQSLENALQEEMLQHAPLYGVGLRDLSMKELETLSRIHEDGLKEIHNLQRRISGPNSNPV